MNKVKKLREFYGYTDRQLAEMVSISKSTINDIETEQHIPNVFVAIRLSQALQTTVEELFWEEKQ